MNPQTAKYRETATDKLDFAGLRRAQGHCLQQFWEPGHAGLSPVKGRQSSGRAHSPTIGRTLDLRFTEHGLAPQSKTLFSLQPAPPNRRLPQASYSHPSEGRQNENYNFRKLTKLITWITTSSNSMKLWARPCRATQDGRVMVESSDKMWSTGEGRGNALQHSCL